MKDFIFSLTHVFVRLFCFLLVFASMSAFAQNYKISTSGTGAPSKEVETDDVILVEIEPGVEVELEHNGIAGTNYGNSSFGDIVNQWLADFVFDLSFLPCENNIGFQIANYLRQTHVLRAANGDMLFREMSESPPSVMCWNPIDDKLRALIHLDIVGGTGRLEGATGNSTLTYEIRILPSGGSANFGTEEGHIDK